MRHLKRVAKLNRTKSHRKALFQNLANALFEHEKITTTSPKAMELKRVADRLITLAKKKDQHAMRLAFSMLRNKEIVKKLFADIVDRYSTINGGYTRVLKIGNRKGDNAPMAIIELTMRKEKEEKKEKAKKTKGAKAPKESKAGKETKPKKEAKEPKAKKETKAKGEAKAKKEPKAKKEAKAEKAETKEPKEKKPRKKKEETKEEEVK
jgi:large subunit ribosomal protein L17